MSTSPLSIIFCGTPQFAVPTLATLLQDKRFTIPLVVTQPDRPQGRTLVMTPPPVKVAALHAGIPVFQPESFNREFAAYCEKKGIARPDVLVVVAYGHILSRAALATPTIAPVNVHASLLPRWRGASPIEHAILAGDTETGITAQVMVEELDAGPIIGQHSIPIDPRETKTTLHDTLARLSAQILPDLLASPFSPIPQPTEGITFCKKLVKADGFVDPQVMTAEEIDRAVRALTPWPGVTCTVDGGPIKILETALGPATESTPLPCAHGTTLYLVTVQPAGKKPMSGAAWARGRR